jgi:hypothetical protein
MSTFIKAGLWTKKKLGFKGELNLDDLITSKINGGGGSSYLKYTAVLGQIDENDPQVIVLENTIGNIVWTRQIRGNYIATLVGAFPENKTWVSAITGANYGNSGYFNFTRNTSDELRLIFDDGALDINSSDDDNIVYECSIEIRVYP